MKDFQQAVSFLLGRLEDPPGNPAQGLCRDFLQILATSPGSPEGMEARKRLESNGKNPVWGKAAALLLEGEREIRKEVEAGLQKERTLEESLRNLAGQLRNQRNTGQEDLFEAFWKVFCPQAAGVRTNWEAGIQELRDRRKIRISDLCPYPLEKPAKEVLFTSNALLTLPPDGKDPAELNMGKQMREGLERVMGEEQAFWYDHPVQMGTAPEKNEILYGLKGLSNMLRFEKNRGNADPQDRLTVVLSASVTHTGLQELARSYLEGEISRTREIESLDPYVFTEEDTTRIVEDFLCPAAKRFGLEEDEAALLSGIFGVDGAYGRHYSFLKAVAALWHVTKDPRIRGTFKIDLDQVFPQDQLVRETGKSAFDLLQSPLWGANGLDRDGPPVALGMIAGALVNQGDIGKGLFTPDVTRPDDPLSEEEFIFASRIPQALSTEAEMMTRYGEKGPDGRSACMSRVHVTGGTVGIRVDSLRRYRPFTLSCISRAEDQAYLMSVLYNPGPPYLRYVHMPGLIMRHDKHTFAGEAIRAAAAGKVVGDLERMFLFSRYADSLPWPLQETRSSLAPFTACFILTLPLTTALLRLALKTLTLNPDESRRTGLTAEELLKVGADRLLPHLRSFQRDPEWIGTAYDREKRAWNSYYAILDRLEEAIQKGRSEAMHLAEKARSIIMETRVDTK